MAFNYRMEETPLAAKPTAKVTPMASPSIPDRRSLQDRKRQQEELNDRLAYTRAVYGSGQSTYQAHQANIDAQYEYNQKRAVAGLPQLAIADPSWNPKAHSDDANEALDAWYRRNGTLPRLDQRVGFNRLLHLYKAEKAMHGQDSTPKDGPTSGASPATQATSAPSTFAGGLSQLRGNDIVGADGAGQPSNTKAPERHSAMDPLTIGGGMSQLMGNVMEGQPTAYEQAKALGMQTGPTKTSKMYGAGDTGGQSSQNKPLNFWDSLLNPYAENANPTVKAMRQINDAVMKYNPSNLAADLLIVRPMQAVKSLYLNGLAAATQAASGKDVTYTPDMTYGQYTAKVADTMNSPDYFHQVKDYYAGDEHKKQLAQALGVSPDSALVNNVALMQAQLINQAGEIAADPTSYLGVSELQALGRGGRALKLGDVRYEAALWENKVNGGLKPLDDASAWPDEKVQAGLARETERGYTQGGGQAAGKVLEDGAAAARRGAEGAGDVGKVITEINYTPSSGVIFKANPNITTTVLGSFDKDMKNIINEMGNVKSTDFGARKGGFNVLNVPDDIYRSLTRERFWEQYNKRWLDEAIIRGDDIFLATKPEGIVLSYVDRITGEEVITGFGREYNYLIERGYVYDSATNMMKKR